MNKKYFFYPLVIFLFCFAFDKLLYFEGVLHSLVKWNRFEMSAYKTREILFNLYKEEPKPKIVLLGSSRLASLQRNEVETSLPNYSFYNFCVPLPSVSYLFYVLQRLSSIQKPAFVLLELDLPMFTRRALQYPFRYGIPLNFFLEHWQLWDKKDFGLYLGKKLFLVGRYPISLNAMRENHSFFSFYENGKLVRIQKKAMIPLTEKSLLDLIYNNHGGIATPYSIQPKPLEIDATEKWSEFYTENPFPREQIPFLEEIVKHIRKELISLLVLLPPSSYEFREILIQHKQEEFLEELLQVFFQEKEVLDLRDFPCNYFEDSFHLGKECIQSVSLEIIHNLNRQLK